MKLVFAFIFCLGFNTMFTQALITDRPDQTESSSTVALGQFQIETGSVMSHPDNYWTINSSLFRVGIGDNLELRMVTGLGYFLQNSFSSITPVALEDIQIGLKYRIINGPVELAYLGHLFTPSGSDNVTADKIGISNKICLSHGVTENIGFGYNLGYDYFSEDENGLTYAYVIGMSLTEKVGFFVELFGHTEKFDNGQLNFDTGFTFLLHENLQIDISTGFGLTENTNFYSAGLSWRLPK